MQMFKLFAFSKQPQIRHYRIKYIINSVFTKKIKKKKNRSSERKNIVSVKISA